MLTRKEFLRKISPFFLLPAAFIWINSIVTRLTGAGKQIDIKLPSDIPAGVSFMNNIIVTRSGSVIKILSSRCPHLGCRINKLENGQLVCPCHGSRFSLTGKVITGPALKPLKSLPFKFNSESNELIVHAEE